MSDKGKEKEVAYPGDSLRTIVDQYNGIQKQRLAAESRAREIKHGKDEGNAAMYERLGDQLKALEDEVASGFKSAVDNHVVGEWLLSVRGIGPTMAAKMIGHTRDIRRFSTVSKLWRYAGYGTVPRCQDCDAWIDEVETASGDREFLSECQSCGSDNLKNVAERPVKGRRLRYDPNFKTMLHTMADGLLRAGSEYRSEYDDAYQNYLMNRPSWSHCADCDTTVPECREPEKHGDKDYRARKGKGWSTGRVHLAARRKMIKLFLSHFFEAWKRIEGLVIRPLYVHEVLGHDRRSTPEDFVDYDLPKIKWAKGSKFDD